MDYNPFLDDLDSDLSSSSAYESPFMHANASVDESSVSVQSILVQVLTRNILQSYISSHKLDVFRSHQVRARTYLILPREERRIIAPRCFYRTRVNVVAYSQYHELEMERLGSW